jgi:hypothetical protein
MRVTAAERAEALMSTGETEKALVWALLAINDTLIFVAPNHVQPTYPVDPV